MNNTFNNTQSLLSKSTCNTVTDISHEISTAAKLRRLKIEEDILLQCLNKIDKNVDGTHALAKPFTECEYRTFFSKTRNSFSTLKKQFLDVKTSVTSQEMLKSTEICDIRGNILELENHIKSFKTSLQTDLLALKSTERQLNSDLCEGSLRYVDKNMKCTKPQVTKYNEVVPSPVKILMNSPFKCVEVEEFQNFMKNSLNQYGGWNEYNHNIFINSWQKFFYTENCGCWEDCEIFNENSSTFQAFLEEIFPKLQGVITTEIISHAKWYIKYMTLKERQREAIDKWRINRERMKKSTKVKQNSKRNIVGKTPQNSSKTNTLATNNVYFTDKAKLGENKDEVNKQLLSSNNHNRDFIRQCEDSMQDKPSRNKSSYGVSNQGVEIIHFIRPTIQWSRRCNNKSKEPAKHTIGLEYIKKLGTPTWRKGF